MDFLHRFNKKNIVFYFCLFLLVFSIGFVVTYVFMPLECDDVWLYGFCYNLTRGMVIYRDYNVVTTPLYYFVGYFFLKIFGNYVISIDIFNSMLVSIIVLMMFKNIKYKSFIVFPLILIFFPNGYNLFALFWLMLILFLIDNKKDNDLLIAFIIGLLFITKQNVGIFLLIPYLYYSRHKIKGLICFSIPFILISIYLILNNAFYEFVDYCFLGLFEFGTGNNYYDVFAFVEIFIILYLSIKLFKSMFNDKKLFYILFFQIMMYPLSDAYHFWVSFFPVMYYLIKDVKNVYLLTILFFSIWYFKISLFLTVNFNIYYGNDILFLKNCGDLPILMSNFNEYLEDEEYYYFTGYYGYLYKLYYNLPITKYDLWNEGNMGYKGGEKRVNEVDEICKENECLFIVDGDLEYNKKSQVNKFFNYIVDNYEKIGEYSTFYIYSNVKNRDNK